MFEGKLPIAPGAAASEHGETVRGELCVPDWSDLTARLAAARDLRRELQGDDDLAIASFDAHCAAKIAAQQGGNEGEGKYAVNPDDLANGKGPPPILGQNAENSDPANRGNT